MTHNEKQRELLLIIGKNTMKSGFRRTYIGLTFLIDIEASRCSVAARLKKYLKVVVKELYVFNAFEKYASETFAQ